MQRSVVTTEWLNDAPDFSESSTITSTSTRFPSTWSWLFPAHDPTLSDVLWMYVGPALFITGVIGNSLVLIASSCRPMTGTSTSVYLRFMAATDLLTLVMGIIPDWLDARHSVNIKELHPFTCKSEKFVFYTSSDSSIWICVAFTLDRFVAVCFPMQRQSRSGKRVDKRPEETRKYSFPALNRCNVGVLGCGRVSAAVCYSIAALIAAMAKNSHVFWTRGPEYKTVVKYTNSSADVSMWETTTVLTTKLISVCGHPTAEYRKFEKFVRPWMAFAFVSAAPFCVIAFCNVFIVRAMIRMRRNRTEVSLVSSMTANGSAIAAAQVAATNNAVFQTTALCLSASFCFLVCITPSMVMLIGKPYWNEPPNETYAVVKSITNQIFYVNHSINFFLYCITGKRFRLALRRACCCCYVRRCCCGGCIEPQVGAWTTMAARQTLATTANGSSSSGRWRFDPHTRQQVLIGRSCPPTPTGTSRNGDVLPTFELPVRRAAVQLAKKPMHGSVGDLLDRRTAVPIGALQQQLLWKMEQQTKKQRLHPEKNGGVDKRSAEEGLLEPSAELLPRQRMQSLA